jgi:hypothetical protein
MRERLVLTVASDQLDQINEVASQVADVGFEVEQVLPTIGVITGSVDQDQVPALEALEGIDAVELDRDVSIPPPDSEIS